MNNVDLLGRLIADPEVRYSGGDKPTAIANFTLAVSRRKKVEGKPDADFIRCTAFGKTAETLEKYVKKGQPLVVNGSITTDDYTDKDGKKVYTTKVTVSSIEFVPKVASDNARADSNNTSQDNSMTDGGFVNVPNNIDSDFLPFA